MVDNRIIQIINSRILRYADAETVCFFSSNGVLKYVMQIRDFRIEVSYDIIDQFYKIRVEKNKQNEFQNTIFLTKSKKFYKDIKRQLQRCKLSKKSFKNHMIAFLNILENWLKEYNNVDFIGKTYPSNLKFDGIFI